MDIYLYYAHLRQFIRDGKLVFRIDVSDNLAQGCLGLENERRVKAGRFQL